MSSKDKAAIEGMARRPTRLHVASDVADSVIGDMVQEGIVHILMSNLFRSPYQVEEAEQAADIDRLAESIQSGTLISPIIVRPILNPNPNRRIVQSDIELDGVAYEIIAGHHRVQACLQLGYVEIQCLVRKMTDAAAAIALTSDNSVRKDRRDFERYQSIVMLEKVGACKTNRDVARVMGISTTQVSMLRLFSKLPEDALQVVKANPDKFSYRFLHDLDAVNFLDTEASLVADAFARLADGRTQNRAAAVKWIKLKISQRDVTQVFRLEYKIEEPGRPSVKIITTDDGATISSKGLDHEKLSELIRLNIQSLYK